MEDPAGLLLIVENLMSLKLKGKISYHMSREIAKLLISMQGEPGEAHRIRVYYKGSPKRGMIFQDAPHQLYTVFFTEDWMVCHASPDDKAKIKMDLLLPNGVTSVASGELLSVEKYEEGKSMHFWEQDYENSWLYLRHGLLALLLGRTIVIMALPFITLLPSILNMR